VDKSEARDPLDRDPSVLFLTGRLSPDNFVAPLVYQCRITLCDAVPAGNSKT